jgi:hypothetical protein
VTAFLAAVGVAVVTGGFTLAGLWLGSRREHSHWLREARRRAYADLSTGVLVYQMATGVPNKVMEKVKTNAKAILVARGEDPAPQLIEDGFSRSAGRSHLS